ncbi:GNAT superfamily N-acetyltransferase [Mucilaginibacter sp. UYNi724]
MNTYQIKEGLENMDVAAIHHFLNDESYWAKGIPLETVENSLKNSFCVGLFDDKIQIGFARFVTDYATFAYLADVYILKDYRGKGLSKLLIKHMMDLEWTKGLRRMLLATLDAHSLYKQFGFQSPANPEWLMEIKRNDLY